MVPVLKDMAVVVLSLAFQRRFSYAAVRGENLPDWIRMTTIQVRTSSLRGKKVITA